jgi:hypothetical protein
MRTEWEPEQVSPTEPIYPIVIWTHDYELIDRAGNVESAVSVLYGCILNRHDGKPRRIVAPASMVDRLRAEAEANADCWGIPIDIVEAA